VLLGNRGAADVTAATVSAAVLAGLVANPSIGVREYQVRRERRERVTGGRGGACKGGERCGAQCRRPRQRGRRRRESFCRGPANAADCDASVPLRPPRMHVMHHDAAREVASGPNGGCARPGGPSRRRL
jgi:hypothetical protein